MKNFKRLRKYKEREPEETVETVRGILSGCGISVSEENRLSSASGVASSRVRISGFEIGEADFGTNGKGMTQALSLASAYGEMMERLQCQILFGDYGENAYYSRLTKYMAAPDEVMLDIAGSYAAAREVIDPLMRISKPPCAAQKGSPKDLMPCLPFYDFFGGGKVLLPYKTLRMVTGSNGMCAGNTFKEALVQGICEIYERAAVKEAYEKNAKVRQINPGCFEGSEILKRLENMKEYGFAYKILDLSMGKKYPVVGLLLEADGRAAFRAGADPCPVTALERCLTEIFQGDEREISVNFKSACCPSFPEADERTKRMISEEEVAYHIDGSGMTARCLFHPQDEYAEDFPGTCALDLDEDYEYITSLTRSLGYGLYVRDWSFLGFPAYQIIIPELSNYDLVYEDGEEIFKWSFEKTEFPADRYTKGAARILNALFEKYEKNVPAQDASARE